jgi:hypothetical protein
MLNINLRALGEAAGIMRFLAILSHRSSRLRSRKVTFLLLGSRKDWRVSRSSVLAGRALRYWLIGW